MGVHPDRLCRGRRASLCPVLPIGADLRRFAVRPSGLAFGLALSARPRWVGGEGQPNDLTFRLPGGERRRRRRADGPSDAGKHS
jgi:hypothetical protein